MLLLVLLFSPLVVASTHIVSFPHYSPHSDLQLCLHSLLFLSSRAYQILPRHVATPTDFLLLETSDPSILSLLRPHVLSLSPQSTLRHPLSHPVHPDFADSSTPTLHAFDAGTLWKKGFTGKGVKVAIFDTGIAQDHTHFPNIAHASDWTGDNSTVDTVGHGTFIAGLIGGSHPACPGVAPHAQLYIFRVFTGAQVSYTSWFLDAFNHALHMGVDVLNLSIGGPDFADKPFVEKVDELVANGIVIVSAIGNDGPVWGSLNNPGDMMAVVGVGGAEPDGTVARFSSRGMTTHELEYGIGRMKPDLVAYGRSLIAPSHTDVDQCRKLSGTSVASPVVAGAIALLMSTGESVNPAKVKKALIEGAKRIEGGAYEQGAGLLDIGDAYEVLKKNGNLTVFPNVLDWGTENCEYMWPHCSQGVWKGLWVETNLTILDGRRVKGSIERVEWIERGGGEILKVEVKLPERFWPWAGGLGVRIGVEREVFGRVEGMLKIYLGGEIAEVGVRVDVVKKPKVRALWDVFHNVRYPPGYLPRDSLKEGGEMLDWLGDHPWTNFGGVVRELVKEGVGVEVLDRSFVCEERDGVLVVVDTEEFWSREEIERIAEWVNEGGGIVIMAEWFSEEVMKSIGFYDDNTRSWWKAVMGGGNVPGLNELLAEFGFALGDQVVSGEADGLQVKSGVAIVEMPWGEALEMEVRLRGGGRKRVVIGGIAKVGRGVVAVIGDSNCIDTAYAGRRCYDMFVRLVKFVAEHSGSEVAELPKFFKHSIWTKVEPTKDWDRAKEASEDLLRLFKPHSRILEQHGNTIRPSDARVHEACRTRQQGWQPAEKSATRVTSRFTKARRASPVGSELRYLQYVEDKRLGRRHGWEVAWGSVWMLLCGTFLIASSMLLRKRAQKRRRQFAELTRYRSCSSCSTRCCERVGLRGLWGIFARSD